MKTYYFLLVAIFSIGCLQGCKEDEIEIEPLASINITNAIVGGKVARLNTNLRDSALNMNFKPFAILANNTATKVYPSGNPDLPYYSANIGAKSGDYYSLFLGGNVASTIDAVLVKDSYKNYKDSVFAVRFVNMVGNSSPISVNLLGSANGSEVPSLPYKSVAEFKTYKGDYKNLTYIFEIRDAGTAAVLGTYTFKPTAPSANPIPRFQNVTLVWKGTVGGIGANAVGILRVNNY